MTRFSGPHSLRKARSILSFSGILALAACGGGSGSADAPEEPWVEVVPLPVSFLEGGGMPHLSPSGDGALLSWLAPEDGDHVLRAVRWDVDGGFDDPVEVARGDDFFVNWADFPSVVEVAPDRWVAHWLQRGGQGTYDYGVRIATSDDAGTTWGRAWTPHEDGTATEHGFVTVWPDGEGGFDVAWLDGRRYAPGDHGEATEEMTVRTRHVGPGGDPASEELVDARTCDCCQTDVAHTARGPVLVYRDRSPEEVRDIYASRWTDGAWSEGRPVHRDGWVIPGCPVNGPAADGRDDAVVVAWFSAADDIPTVRVAFSADAGGSFGEAVRVDDGNPVGRADVVLAADGSALVLWLENTGNGGGELRLRRVEPEGGMGPSTTLAPTRSARAAGFPQMIPVAGDGLLLAWTESGSDGPEAVRVARLEVS